VQLQGGPEREHFEPRSSFTTPPIGHAAGFETDVDHGVIAALDGVLLETEEGLSASPIEQ
jgi:hypothetical protein